MTWNDSWTIFTHCFVISRPCRREITQLPGVSQPGITPRTAETLRSQSFQPGGNIWSMGSGDPGIVFWWHLFRAVCECLWSKYTQYIYIYDLIINIYIIYDINIYICDVYIKYILYIWYIYIHSLYNQPTRVKWSLRNKWIWTIYIFDTAGFWWSVFFVASNMMSWWRHVHSNYRGPCFYSFFRRKIWKHYLHPKNRRILKDSILE